MSIVFLFSALFTLPYAARAATTLADASVIPPFHKMVPPFDPTHKETNLGGGNASQSNEVLNLNFSQPVMPIQWSPAVSEITDLNNTSYALVRPLFVKIKTLLEPEWSHLNTIQHGTKTTLFVLPPHASMPGMTRSINITFQACAHALTPHDAPPDRYLTTRPLDFETVQAVVHLVSTYTNAFIDWLISTLISVQMLVLGSICLPLVYAPCVLLYTGVFAVVIDLAKAVVGCIILITGLGPHRLKSHVIMIRAFTFIDRICLNMIIVCILCTRCLRSRLSKLLFVGIGAFLLLLPYVEATGRETPKVTFQDYFLPGVTRWDGYPYHDFRRVWWVALCAALGNISQEGWSLLQTARDQDLGAPGNPGTPAQTIVSNNRNERVFGAILNYIEATSYLYHYVSTTFANDGRGLFAYLWVVGHLPYTHEERTTLDAEWKEATIASAGIKYSPKAVFEWANYVNILADKLGKSEMEKRVKYLAGFPSSFDVLVVAERARPGNGSYLHPANYPAHHPQAGNAHPLAGQPDIVATATAFYGEWARMCNEGLIKSIPKGFARRVDSDDDSASDGEHANLARNRATTNTVCLVCGGLGHASKVDGVGTCLTAKLGNRVPREHLNQIKYPEGYNPPRNLWLAEPGHKSNQRPYMRNANPNARAQYSNPTRDTSYSNPSRVTFRHGKARMLDAEFEPTPSRETEWVDEHEDEAPEDDEAAKRMQQQRSRQQYRRPSLSRSRPRPRARQTDAPPPPSQETPQNSAHDAYESYHESDEVEQGRLAVATGNITFN